MSALKRGNSGLIAYSGLVFLEYQFISYHYTTEPRFSRDQASRVFLSIDKRRLFTTRLEVQCFLSRIVFFTGLYPPMSACLFVGMLLLRIGEVVLVGSWVGRMQAAAIRVNSLLPNRM